MTSSARAKPLPGLPMEIQAQILSHCDAQTLGRACLVSLAFLELAGPVLYKHITITGLHRLDKMFYNEDRISSGPHLDRFLSLDQTRTFTFVGTPQDAPRSLITSGANRKEELPRLLFHPKRSSCSFPLRVARLGATFHHAGRRPGDITDLVTGTFLALFDPEHVVLAASSPPLSDQGYTAMCVDLEDVPWTRVRTLSMDEIEWWYLLSHMTFYQRLPLRSLAITYDLNKPLDTVADLWTKIVEDVIGQDAFEGALLEAGGTRVAEIIIKVNSVRPEAILRSLLRQEWQSLGVDEEEQDGQLAMIRFVVV